MHDFSWALKTGFFSYFVYKKSMSLEQRRNNSPASMHIKIVHLLNMRSRHFTYFFCSLFKNYQRKFLFSSKQKTHTFACKTTSVNIFVVICCDTHESKPGRTQVIHGRRSFGDTSAWLMCACYVKHQCVTNNTHKHSLSLYWKDILVVPNFKDKPNTW